METRIVDGVEYVKIQYGENERGWAERLALDLYKINNIPMSDGLNYGDVVRPGRNGLTIVERGLHFKVIVQYDLVAEFDAVKKLIKDRGLHRTHVVMEGLKVPQDGTRGAALLAVSDDMDQEGLDALFEGTSFRLSDAYGEEDEDNE